MLVELSELAEAEQEVAAVLEEEPEHEQALRLLAKIKHTRGELSEAVACWAHLAPRDAPLEVARLHLTSMLHMAQDPVRGAGEFMALGGFRLARKPLAYLELEEAFRLFHARAPRDARVRARRVAEKYRTRDREVRKLALLAEAWIAELSGELDSACEVLEALGRERGFETDLDRLLALAGLYEAIGTPERLRMAVQILEYLEEQHLALPLLGRLALLHRHLGDEARARLYQRRHEAVFRQDMFRPTQAEVALAAAGSYLPLPRLCGLRLPGGEEAPRVEAGPRERAVALALRGDLQAARAMLDGEEAPLDLHYRADLALMRGDLEAGVELHLRGLAAEAEPWTGRVWGALFDLHAATPGVPPCQPLVEWLGRPERAAQAREALLRALEVGPREAACWARLATLEEVLGGAEEAAQYRLRAQALRGGASGSVGRVLSAAVYRLPARPKGLIHQVWASRSRRPAGQGGGLAPEQVLGNVTDELRGVVLNAFVAVREFARARFPDRVADLDDWDYSFKVTKDDEPSGGASAGLPAALAFLSVFLQRPVSQEVAFTGTLVADSHASLSVQPVGDIEHKVRGAYHRNLRHLVVPLRNRVELEHSCLVPRAISEELVIPVSRLDEAIEAAFGPGSLLL